MEKVVCKRCVMDNESDPTITFNKDGFCNYCTKAISEINTTSYFPNEVGDERLEMILAQIKKAGYGKEYDCIMGLSGGLDSSYLAYLGIKWGLRILAVHIDDGFDTEISKNNIQKLINTCKIDMLTIHPDNKQYLALTKAYMKAGVPNLAIPQDNVLFAFLYDVIRKKRIKYFLTGGNFALECILQEGNTYNAMDIVNIYDIHRKFGTEPINKLKFISSYRKYFDMKITGLKTLRLLNYIDYNRERAFQELEMFCNFEYYGSKHLENILTAFVQLYWLPKKFGVDKRKSHLSSMIVSGQLSREEALRILKEPMCNQKLIDEYIRIIKEKFCISDSEFEQLMKAPTHSHEFYKTDRISPVVRKLLIR